MGRWENGQKGMDGVRKSESMDGWKDRWIDGKAQIWTDRYIKIWKGDRMTVQMEGGERVKAGL